jgi:hypothetical protein
MLRIGISGYNDIAESIIGSINTTQGATLSGIHTDVPTENAALAGTGFTIYNSFKELIQNSDVIVWTNVEGNALPVAEKVIKHGKHIYIHHLQHFQDDYIGYLSRLSSEADVKTFINFELIYNPVVKKLQTLLGDPQIIDVSLGRMEGSSEDVTGDRYLVAASLLVKLLSRRTELPRLHVQTLHRLGSNGNPIQLRLEYPSGCLANVMLHGDAVPGHNRIRVYQGSGYTEADLDFGLISMQGYNDTDSKKSKQKNTDALINVDANPETDAGLKHFLHRLIYQGPDDYVTFDDLYDATKSVAPVRQKLRRYGVSVQ